MEHVKLTISRSLSTLAESKGSSRYIASAMRLIAELLENRHTFFKKYSLSVVARQPNQHDSFLKAMGNLFELRGSVSVHVRTSGAIERSVVFNCVLYPAYATGTAFGMRFVIDNPSAPVCVSAQLVVPQGVKTRKLQLCSVADTIA